MYRVWRLCVVIDLVLIRVIVEWDDMQLQYLHEDEEVLEPPLLEEPHKVGGQGLLLIRRNLQERKFLYLKQKLFRTQVSSHYVDLKHCKGLEQKKSLSISCSRK